MPLLDSRVERLAARVVPAAAGLLALAVGAWVVRPFSAAPVGFDTAASVLHFDRIVAGRPLEGLITTTPKPLLTVGDGLIHALAGDWRAVSWAAILGFAFVAMLAAVLAWRVSGPLAAAFAGVGLAGLPSFLSDVATSNAVVWAVLLWLLAALALLAARPRYVAAGLLLMLASLARIEALVVVTACVAAVAALDLVSRTGRVPRPPRAAYWLALGFLALPAMLLHDWLLTGDPWFWTSVATFFSEGASQHVMTPQQIVGWLAERYRTMAPVTLLAAIGFLDLAVRARRSREAAVSLIGLAAVAGGVLAFLVFLAFRRTYVSDRYPIPVDVAFVFAAGIGVAALTRAAGAAWRRWGSAREGPAPTSAVTAPPGRSLAGIVVALAVGGGVAVLALAPYGPLDRPMRSYVSDLRAMNAALDLALPTLRSAAGSVTSPEERALRLTYRELSPSPAVFVPVLLRPRAAVDLDLPVWMLASGMPLTGEGADTRVRRTTVLMHLARDDAPAASYRVFETSSATVVGAVRIVPLLVRPDRGLWVVRLEPIP